MSVAVESNRMSRVLSGEPRIVNRRAAIIAIVFTTLLCESLFGQSPATTPRGGNPSRPNVLFITVDDLNDWTGYLGGYEGTVMTPNLDALAQRGVWFTRAYCASPICNSSRICTLTGLRASTTGVYEIAAWRYPLRNVVTLPDHFRNEGYLTVRAGLKVFHNFDATHWDLFFNNTSEATPPSLPATGNQTLYTYGYDFGPVDQPDANFIDYKTATYCEQFFGSQQTEPFMLCVGTKLPHGPFYAPRSYYDMYPLENITLPTVNPNDLNDLPATGFAWANGIPGNPINTAIQTNNLWPKIVQAYLACTTFVDVQIGRIVNALNSSQYADNTIIVLWSDNGFQLGEKTAWGKSTFWNEATRIPMIVIAPGVTPMGQACDRPVTSLDIYPTLIELCGLTPKPELEGTSLVPLLSNPSMPWTVPAVQNYRAGLSNTIRTEDWRYIRYADNGEELYDENADPREWTNLAGNPGFSGIKSLLASQIITRNAPPVAQGPQRFYVNVNATGANNGTSWQNAFTDLSMALNIACSNYGYGTSAEQKEIWVAKGTYRPAGPGGNRHKSFIMPPNVGVFGGFAGNETNRGQRNPAANVTILSGDLNDDDGPGFTNRDENSYHVVFSQAVYNIYGSFLDGFTITGGNANGGGWNDRGGGIHLDHSGATISRCIIKGNLAKYGGGVYNGGGGNSLTTAYFVECLFQSNKALESGGAAFNDDVAYVQFNASSSLSGGCRPIYYNCTIAGNTAVTCGGTGGTGLARPSFYNCLISNNTDSGGLMQAAQFAGGSLTIRNCCVQGWTGSLGGVGNFGADPQFLDTIGGDGVSWSGDELTWLRPNSVCSDAGANSFVALDAMDMDGDNNLSEPIPYDLGGRPRFVDNPLMQDTGSGTAPIVDIGAYEVQILCPGGDINNDGLVNGRDIQPFIDCLISESGANCQCADLNNSSSVTIDDVAPFVSLLAGS